MSSLYYRRKLSKYKKNRKSPEIVLTPLIDTALTLLVIFMITAPVINNSIKVDLPRGSRKEANTQGNPIAVTIDKDLNLYIGDEQVAAEEFLDELYLKLPRDQEFVVLYGDQSIPYSVIIQLIDRIKSLHGIKYVALSTKPN